MRTFKTISWRKLVYEADPSAEDSRDPGYEFSSGAEFESPGYEDESEEEE